MELPKLRDYQLKGINLTRKAFSDGYRKIMFFLATGGGKSVIFLHLVANLRISKKRVILVVKRKQLVLQAHRHFKRRGIKSSILMANNKGFDPGCPIQICSIDTVARRDIDFMKDFEVCIVDEAHDTTSPTYHKFFERVNCELFIGLSATPFKVGNKCQSYWNCCVKPVEMHELRDKGFLTPAQIFIPGEIDLSGIKTVGGDYQQKQLAEKMSELEIVGDVVESYQKLGQNLPAVLFAVNVDHSMMLAREFTRRGVPAAHCDKDSKQEERDRRIQELKDGKIKVICNVNIFSTGVDIPEAMVGILARPTKSEILYVQQAGRFFRPYRKCGKCSTAYDNSPKCPTCGYDKPSFIKEKAILIDNGNNVMRHGDPFKVRYAVLNEEDEKKKKENEQEEFKVKYCKGCFAAYMANLSSCPYCDYENEKVQRQIKRVDGKIVPYDEFSIMLKKLNDLERVQIIKGLKPNFKYFQLYNDFGDAVYKYKELGVPKWVKTIVEKQNNEKQKVYK